MADRLYEDVGLNKREAKEFVDAFFDALREALEHGRQVKLSGFGNFDLRRKNLLRRDEMPYFNPNGMPYDHVAPIDAVARKATNVSGMFGR